MEIEGSDQPGFFERLLGRRKPAYNREYRLERTRERYRVLDHIVIGAAGEPLREFLLKIPLVPVEVIDPHFIVVYRFSEPRPPRKTEKASDRVYPVFEAYEGGAEKWHERILYARERGLPPWDLLISDCHRRTLEGIVERVAYYDPPIWQESLRSVLRRALRHHDTQLIRPMRDYYGRLEETVSPRRVIKAILEDLGRREEGSP